MTSSMLEVCPSALHEGKTRLLNYASLRQAWGKGLLRQALPGRFYTLVYLADTAWLIPPSLARVSHCVARLYGLSQVGMQPCCATMQVGQVELGWVNDMRGLRVGAWTACSP